MRGADDLTCDLGLPRVDPDWTRPRLSGEPVRHRASSRSSGRSGRGSRSAPSRPRGRWDWPLEFSGSRCSAQRRPSGSSCSSPAPFTPTCWLATTRCSSFWPTASWCSVSPPSSWHSANDTHTTIHIGHQLPGGRGRPAVKPILGPGCHGIGVHTTSPLCSRLPPSRPSGSAARSADTTPSSSPSSSPWYKNGVPGRPMVSVVSASAQRMDRSPGPFHDDRVDHSQTRALSMGSCQAVRMRDWRSWLMARARVGPMLPMGMRRRQLISV